MRLKTYNTCPKHIAQWDRTQETFTINGFSEYSELFGDRKTAYKWVRDNRRIVQADDRYCLVSRYEKDGNQIRATIEIQYIG